MSTNNNIVEKNILINIDSLVKIVIQMSQSAKENFKSYFPEVEDLLSKTNSLLSQLIQREEIPFEQIYRQLIAQRLPQPEFQKCFGNLEPALEAIFSLPLFHNQIKKQAPATTSEATATPALTRTNHTSEKPEVNLDKLLTALYPKERILKNHYLRSIKLDYFLPERKLAVLLRPLVFRRPTSLNLLAHRENLYLIEISPQDLSSPHRLSQKFPRFSSSC